MKKLVLLFFILNSSLITLTAQVSTLLNIPPRIQWPNNDGYCGENSIQMCGLYYGNYISEVVVRDVAGGELLVYVNDTAALDSLNFNYVEWDPNPNPPQYMTYLDWVKQYLYQKQPVIITVYVSGMSDPDYDHIIPAIGFYANSVNTYNATDSLTYNTNFDTVYFTRAFSTIYATRAQANNSAPYPYYIPKNVDYGVAVTGNKDPGKVTRPVHIVLDSNDEPNVTLGVPPCMLRATITADSLTIGKSYALLRYNNYRTVPSTGFKPSGANSVVYFTATAVTHTVIDSFMSDTAVFYRCIPYSVTGIEEESTDNDNVVVFPNPNNGVFQLKITNYELGIKNELEIYNMLGEKIASSNSSKGGKGWALDLIGQPAGMYLYRVISDNGEVISNGKFIIQ
ncbi:MAG: T9SS type A sorting domain-containing protein [Bacteroidia bacterium]